jgi:glycosyltransferase involved in cell wall biosynthesis
MKISMLNTYDNFGGAARSAYRLHQGLLQRGIQSQFVSQYKKLGDPKIICGSSRIDKLIALLRPLIDLIPLKIYWRRDRKQPFSSAFVPVARRVRKAVADSEVLHIHWIARGFINLTFLRQVQRPIVWTLHDSWAFTGGCHLPSTCRRYQQACGQCPQLKSRHKFDLTNLNWHRKLLAFRDLDMIVVAPSNWLAECARSSSLFVNSRVEVIPNGIDTDIFKPLDSNLCRRILNLPELRHIILFGAVGASTDENKGFDLMRQAIAALPRYIDGKECMLLIFGSHSFNIPDLNIEMQFMGTLTDDIALSVLYSAADVMVVPSRQENLPNTIMEAMACGTPAVAFRVGGIPDLIEHLSNGYLAKPYDTDDLSRGISWVLEHSGRASLLEARCCQKIESEFKLDVVTKKYIKLYSELVGKAYGSQ